MFEGFFKKIGIFSQEVKEKLLFLINGESLNLNEQANLIEYGLKNGNKITVVDEQNILGAWVYFGILLKNIFRIIKISFI